MVASSYENPQKTKSYITEVFYKYSIGLTLKESINGNY